MMVKLVNPCLKPAKCGYMYIEDKKIARNKSSETVCFQNFYYGLIVKVMEYAKGIITWQAIDSNTHRTGGNKDEDYAA